MLAIEVDGMSHNNEDASLKDDLRQQRLESLGARFLRFSESEVKYDMHNVIRAIEAKMIEIVKIDRSVKLPKGFDLSMVE